MMKYPVHATSIMCAVAYALTSTGVMASAADVQPKAEFVQTNDAWFVAEQQTLARVKATQPITEPAKNIIIFIGDGMGPSTVTAARILDGQQRGGNGEENFLSWEKFPHLALSKTYNTNQQVADSAGAATAIFSGVKTKAGVIGVDSTVTRSDCKSSIGHSVTNALELAEMIGLSTGIVTTASIADATPAAAYAHGADRYWQDDKAMPDKAKAAGCTDFAQQLIEFRFGDGIDVAMGGGRESFIPHTMQDAEDKKKGHRLDGRNLAKEWVENYPNAGYVWNLKQFKAIDPARTDHLLGLFNRSHMQYEMDRNQDRGGEPSLSQMVAKAIDILARNPKGFFLAVEGARIDHAHHAGNAYRALTETIEFSKAVRVAIDKTNVNETLIIVTADHSFVFTIAGYPTRGNPILGKVKANDKSGRPGNKLALAKDRKPYTTLGYANGPGAWQGNRLDVTEVNTTSADYLQQATYAQSFATHGGEDVAIYARGPGAYLFQGVVEQNYIFHVMDDAARLRRRAGVAKPPG